MSFTLRTVSFNFFRNVHPVHYQLCIEGTYAFLYLFAFVLKTIGFSENGFFGNGCRNFLVATFVFRKVATFALGSLCVGLLFWFEV